MTNTKNTHMTNTKNTHMTNTKNPQRTNTKNTQMTNTKADTKTKNTNNTHMQRTHTYKEHSHDEYTQHTRQLVMHNIIPEEDEYKEHEHRLWGHITDLTAHLLQKQLPTLPQPQPVELFQKSLNTGLQRPIGCLISIGDFPRKSPIVSGSFAQKRPATSGIL